MQKLKMHRGATILTAIGFLLWGGVSQLVAAEETKKPGEQTAPRPGKTATVKKDSADQKTSDPKASEKKTPDKKAAAKDKTQKSSPAADSAIPGEARRTTTTFSTEGQLRTASSTTPLRLMVFPRSYPTSAVRTTRASASWMRLASAGALKPE